MFSCAGCDSTSAFFDKGKILVQKWLQANAEIQNIAVHFQEGGISREDVENLCCRLICSLYKCKDPKMMLDDYRFFDFKRRVAKSMKSIQLATLPPTTAAARQHSYRVYHQIAQWKGIKLSPHEWGWQGSPLEPVRTTQQPAPASLLALIFCGCAKGCGQRCGCRTAGLKCSVVCSKCEGIVFI